MIPTILSVPNQDQKIVASFLARAKEGKMTRDENPTSHACVYFAGIDIVHHQVFIGHHKKSGLWLFNGGHIDKGETPPQALVREVGEEWGTHIMLPPKLSPQLLTFTKVVQSHLICLTHYDIWYFINLDSTTFNPDQDLLATEFYQTKWLSIPEALEVVVDPNTRKAFQQIEALF